MGTNVIHAEWIGKHAKIISASNKSLEGLEGIVVDETRNTVIIETESRKSGRIFGNSKTEGCSSKGVKRVQKHGTVFEIDGQEVVGDEVLAPPEERIKLKVSATDVAGTSSYNSKVE